MKFPTEDYSMSGMCSLKDDVKCLGIKLGQTSSLHDLWENIGTNAFWVCECDYSEFIFALDYAIEVQK